MDVRTTPLGNRVYLDVVVHWVDEDNQVQEVLNALLDLRGDYGAANIATVAFKVMEEYNMSLKVGFYMLDNAKSNDTTVSQLLGL